MTTLTDKSVIVRKNHICEWCGQKICIGEKSQYRAYVFYDEFISGWQHLECYDAMNKTDNYYLQEGWSFGENGRGRSIE